MPRRSSAASRTTHVAEAVQQIPVDHIDLPGRPARRFMGDIAALAASMQDYGLQQPISVRGNGDRYIITSGTRRLAAARMLRWKTIPGFVRSVTADDAYLLDLIENLQREDLSPEEEADAFGELIRTRGWTIQQVADSVKRSLAYISKRVRVFEDATLREAITARGLPVSTAEELLAAPPELREALVKRALDERWDQVRARDALHEPEPDPSSSTADLDDLDQLLASAPADRGSQDLGVEPVRPRGFTRAVREFHRLLIGIQPEDLTPSDRSALRALFRDLQMLARAPTTRAERVFPPLPATPQTQGGGPDRRPTGTSRSAPSTRRGSRG
jgi:ParB family chromosome partitioning protein